MMRRERPRATTTLGFKRVGVFSRGIAQIPWLDLFLGARRIVFRPSAQSAATLDAVVGWGHKPTSARARAYAKTHGVPYVRLEDGFLRSAGLTGKGIPLSLVVDDVGIYYDASAPSRLEQLLNADASDDPLSDPELLARARWCRQRIVQAKLSKYNNAFEPPPRWLCEAKRPVTLVVDQTFGDAAISLGQADAHTFVMMVDRALQDNPDGTVVVKTHPDVWSGAKRGYLTNVADGRVKVLRDAVDPAALLQVVDHVYTVSSQLGFEALLREKPVTCFGVPFYAGWGLTRDCQSIPRRQRIRTVDELTAATLILYARYVHPVTRRCCEPEEAIEHLALQRAAYERNASKYFCFGFSAWKREYVRRYLERPGGKVVFCRTVHQARRRGIDAESRIVVWGRRDPAGLATLAEQHGATVCRMEDGFLRSVGLGSDFSAPSSLVLDERGLYYDPTSPSDLEHILQTAQFSAQELADARSLVDQIVRRGISKYNFHGSIAERLDPPALKRVILVPGQVEDDASVQLGSPIVRSNEELLREVRRQNPDAYVVFKVHPDVLSGNRRGYDLARLRPNCDQVVERIPLARCLDVADEVHTMTSLVGFEALLRNKRVVTYGQPFYAGWGLSEDRCPPPRRTRKLSLPELVAGVLLRYPRYYSWHAQAFTTADLVVRELEAQRITRPRELSSPAGGVVRSLRRGRTWLDVRLRRHMPPPLPEQSLSGLRVLLLQGPVGPFFQRLSTHLELAGAEVTKINFNAGDDYFFRRPGAIRYRGTAEEWPAFVEKTLSERRINVIFLFGDTRQFHRVALKQAQQRGIETWVFEEGYVRPDYVTLERGGVNAQSRLPNALEPYLQRSHRADKKPEPVEHGFRMLAWYSVIYSVALTFGQSRYPEYRHHKDLNAWRGSYFWARGLVRKAWYAQTERSVLKALVTKHRKRFYLVPLQVHHDAQVTTSAFGSNERFVNEVLESFAEHADASYRLVLKHHPLDRAYRDYGRVIRDVARQLGIDDRVDYVHDLHLPTLLRMARGTVVLNSTVGCSSLHHGTPVKVLGRAIYDIPGLTYQGTLASFWRDPGSVDRQLFRKYRAGLIAMSQINGCFYSRDIGREVVEWLAR